MMRMIRQLVALKNVNTIAIAQQRSVKAAVSRDFDFDDVKPFEQIPGPRGLLNLPVIGIALHFKPFTTHTPLTMHLLYKDLVDKYGPLVRFNMGGPTVLVADPFDIEVVMKNEGKYPNRLQPAIHQMYCERSGFGRGLAYVQGEEWQKFRSPLNLRMMRVKSAHYYLPVQNEVADHLISRIKTEKMRPEDLMELFFRYTCEKTTHRHSSSGMVWKDSPFQAFQLEILERTILPNYSRAGMAVCFSCVNVRGISVVAFNKRLGYLDKDMDKQPEKLQTLKDIQGVFENMMKSLSIPPFVLKHFPLKVKRDYFEHMDRIVSTVLKYYESASEEIERRKADGTVDHDEYNFMLSLMTTDKLTLKQMAVVALDLYVAGTESTARNLQIMLYSLARNPDKQQKLYEEIIQVIGPSGPLTAEALAKMPYLLACLRESFRVMYPTLSGVHRFLPTDIVLKGYRIPAGTSIFLMNQRTVKNPKYFPDPESFIPERWFRDEDGKRETPIPPSALQPFGFGPRQCAGKRFAEQEIYMAIIKMIQNFKVSLEPGHEDIEVIYKIFISTMNPIRFKFENRN